MATTTRIKKDASWLFFESNGAKHPLGYYQLLCQSGLFYTPKSLSSLPEEELVQVLDSIDFSRLTPPDVNEALATGDALIGKAAFHLDLTKSENAVYTICHPGDVVEIPLAQHPGMTTTLWAGCPPFILKVKNVSSPSCWNDTAIVRMSPKQALYAYVREASGICKRYQMLLTLPQSEECTLVCGFENGRSWAFAQGWSEGYTDGGGRLHYGEMPSQSAQCFPCAYTQANRQILDELWAIEPFDISPSPCRQEGVQFVHFYNRIP